MAEQRITEASVKQFKSDVVLTTPGLVTTAEKRVARAIPNEIFEDALRVVFNGDVALAKDVLYGRLTDMSDSEPEREIDRLSTIAPAAEHLADAVMANNPILVISDVDNDGSLAQAIAMEMRSISGAAISAEAREYEPGTHGFSIAQIEQWVQNKNMGANDPFTVLVADLGTNQREEQQDFLARYPNGHLIIADHHEPDIDAKVDTNADRSWLVSPFIKGGARMAMRAAGGASGSFLLYSVFKRSLIELVSRGAIELSEEGLQNRIGAMRSMAKAANMLDGVSCDARLKPLHEVDIKRAADLSRVVSYGRDIGRWLAPRQVASLQGLSGVIGDEAVLEFVAFRDELRKANHLAGALRGVLHEIVHGDGKVNVANAVALAVDASPVEASDHVNYVEQLRSYLYYFNYESQLPEAAKNAWLSLAEKCFKDVGKTERAITEGLRKHELIKEVSTTNVLITRPLSRAVGAAFSSRTLSKAYHSLSKPISLSVTFSGQDEFALRSRSEVSMTECLRGLKMSLPVEEVVYRGHSKSGALMVKGFQGNTPDSLMMTMAASLTHEAQLILDNTEVRRALYVTPAHLSLMSEMLIKMRVHTERGAMPTLLMRVSDDSTFEDKYTTEKLTVSELVTRREWATTAEPLDFGNEQLLILPNQALKSLSEDGFKGALGLSLLPGGSYIANQVFSGRQLAPLNIPTLTIPLEKERLAMMAEYKEHFFGLDRPVVPLERKVAQQALQITADGEKVFNNTEEKVLGLLARTGADSHVVLDVEKDRECTNAGLCISKERPGSGREVTREQFERIVNTNPDLILNACPKGDGFVINKELDMLLFSQIVGSDGGVSIRVSIKSQNLTNLTQELVTEIGEDATLVEDRILAVLEECGNFIIQAHNLPYDNGVMRIHFPRVYEKLKAAIHLDSAVPSREHSVAYFNMQVNMIERQAFYNATHKGYNLTTLLNSDRESFDFPSIKGGHILQVREQDVYIKNQSTQVVSKLDESRAELAERLPYQMVSMPLPGYSIQKMMHVATIRDLISRQPIKEVHKVAFDGLGSETMDPSLWDKFQSNYAYDLSLEQNIARFSVLPDAESYLSMSVETDYAEAPDELKQARDLGGKTLRPAKKRSKKDQANHDQALNAFSGQDILRHNAVNFLNANADNAERYARVWAYELVLGTYEPTRKTLDKGILEGVSEKTGIDVEVVKSIYDEVYTYRSARGIESMFARETHNNVGLDGDVFQEHNVFIHMLTEKLKNPYLDGPASYLHGIDPNEDILNVLCRQAASSTLKQVIRNTSSIVMDDDKLNTYGAKQLEHINPDGSSIAGEGGGVAKITTRETGVEIELPDMAASKFRKMSTEERKSWEAVVEHAAAAVVLANSRHQKSVTGEVMPILEKAYTSELAYDSLKQSREFFGRMVATTKDAKLKAIMTVVCDAVIDGKPLKLPFNKELNKDDLDVVHDATMSGIVALSESQNFVSKVSLDAVKEVLNNAVGQFLASEQTRESVKNGGGKVIEVVGYEPVDSVGKRSLTSIEKHIGNALQEMIDLNPSLTYSLETVKKDPVDFMLKSPLIEGVMTIEPAPELEQTLDKKIRR